MDKLTLLALRDKSLVHDENSKVKVGPWSDVKVFSQYAKDGMFVYVSSVYVCFSLELSFSWQKICPQLVAHLHMFLFDTTIFPSVIQHCVQARHCSTTRSSPWSETLKSHWICTNKNCVKKEPRLDWPAVGKCLATRKSAPKVRLRTYFGFFDAFCCTRLCCFCAYSAVTRLHTFVG